MYHVILAGGQGHRFWPKSRSDKPKQLLKLFGDQSMIRLTYNRINKISSSDKIFIVASRKLSNLINKEIPEVPKKNYIIEPSGKNTASAIGLAAAHISKIDDDAIMGIYPADHLIIGDEKFKKIILNSKKQVEKKSILITIGIKPSFPSTGYGYIEYEINNDKNKVYKVKTFLEKPKLNKAKKFIKSDVFLWNAGMFVWKANTILKEIKLYMPDLFCSLDNIQNSINTPYYSKVLKSEWELIQPESIDYGILEKTKKAYTILADFTWNDLGTWYSLFKALKKNNEKNHNSGDVITIESKNNLIISQDKLTVVVGVDDVSIISLDNVNLIVSHEKAEMIKDVVNMLKTINRSEFL